jgi:hemerythrin
MPFVTWDDALASDVRIMDSQHRLLAGLLNELHAIQAGSGGQEAMGKVFASLVDGAGKHFSTEERLMLALEYPGYARHKAEHDALMGRILALQRELSAETASITPEIVLFLRDWLTQHIQEADKRLGFFLRKRGIK